MDDKMQLNHLRACFIHYDEMFKMVKIMRKHRQIDDIYLSYGN